MRIEESICKHDAVDCRNKPMYLGNSPLTVVSLILFSRKTPLLILNCLGEFIRKTEDIKILFICKDSDLMLLLAF